jgi:WD40 repeat protein
MSLTTRTFRLFLSSTFSDFAAEREVLQKRVFPEIEKFCAERGARFQAIDLRWGITEEAQQEHDTLRICLEEVRRCQDLSPRPNFAVLLGDRYGWEPVPARVPIEHWERLKVSADETGWGLIQAQYQFDENAVPPVYCLRKREGDWAQAVKREADLLQALRYAARNFRGLNRLPYFGSATHQEIALGALASHDDEGQFLHPEEHVHVYVRRIQGLPKDYSARAFIDWDEAGQLPVSGARHRLAKLESQLRERLPGKVHDLHARWSGSCTDEAHLDAFCERFLADQKAIIERELGSRQKLDGGLTRAAQHQAFAKERARNFAGRRAVLKRIKVYLTRRGQASPLIVHGDGGTGKSALMATAYQKTLADASGQTVLLARFIGGVPGTESLMTLLTELTVDIEAAYGRPASPPPESMKVGRQAFEAALQGATAERPLVLFLDALDQLDRNDGAWLLEWLPRELGEHTRVVASTRTGQTLLQAQRRYPKTLLEVPPMTPAEGRQMLDAWLADTREARYSAGIAPGRGRRLTPDQRKQVLNTFEQTGKPLWLKLAYEEARSWASWHTPTVLPATVEAMVRDLITRRLMEGENHPRALATRALAYITAGRFGLTDEELDHALATDSEVKAEFEAQNAKTGQKWVVDAKRPRLPPILWSRLHFDLQPYLMQAQVHGTTVYRWFHREFKEEIGKTYLSDIQDKRDMHGHLANTFYALAPYGDDLFKYTDVSGTQQPAALRRVMEQPWQLAQAGRHEMLTALLTEFGFCMGKCAANQSNDLVLDCLANPADQSTAHSITAFYISEGHILRRGTSAWPSHRILLQRASESDIEKPIRHGAIAWLEGEHCDWDWLRLVPSSYALHATSIQSATEVVFEGHDGPARGARFLSPSRLLSWSGDGSLKLWDTRTGQCIHSMHFDRGNVWDVAIYGEALASACYVESSVCVVWNIQTGEKVAELSGHKKTITGCAWLSEGRVLTWSEDKTVRLWSATTGDEEQIFDRHTSEVAGAFVLPDRKVASWSASGGLWIWDLIDKTESPVAGSAESAVKGALLLGDGRLVYWTGCGSIHRSDRSLKHFEHVFKSDLEEVSHAQEVAPGLIAVWHELLVHHGAHEHVIEIWDLDRGTRRGLLGGHMSFIEGVAVAPGTRLISYDNHGEIRLWDLHQCSELGVYQGLNQVWAAYSIPPKQLIVCTRDIRIWDIESGRLIAIWDDFDAARTCIPAPGNRMLVTLYDGSMRLVNVGPQFREPTQGLNSNCVTAALLTGDCIVAGQQDGSIAFFDTVDGKLNQSVHAHSDKVKRLAVGIGDLVVSTGEDGAIGLIDSRTRVLLWFHETQRHVMGAWQVCDAAVLVCLIGDGIQILDAKSGRELASVPDATGRGGFRDDQFRGIEIFNRKDKPAEVWDCSNACRLYPLEGHEDDIFYATLLNDTSMLTASKDRTLRVWNHPEGTCRHVLRGHTDWVVHIDVIDQRRVISYAGNYHRDSVDLSLRVWDAVEGHCIGILEKHKHKIGGTLILASGKLLSWSATGEVCLWCLQTLQSLGLWQWNWGAVSSMHEFESGVILARNRDGRAFIWSLYQNAVEEIDLHDCIESRSHASEWLLQRGFAEGLSTTELDGQWIDRRLVVRRHSDSALIHWHADHPGELLSLSRGQIIGVREGRRIRFLELMHAQ